MPACFRALICLAVPGCLLAWVIWTFSCPVPFYDEWNEAGELYQKALESGLSWQDLAGGHSIHFTLFPRLAALAALHWGGGDLRLLSVLAFLLGTGMVIMLCRLARPLTVASGRHLLMCSLIAWSVYSPLQTQTWLWGLCFMVIVPPFILVACLTLMRSRLGLPGKWIVCVLLTWIGLQSYGSAAAAWIAFLLGLLLDSGWASGRPRRVFLLSYFLAACALTVPLLSGFQMDAGMTAVAQPAAEKAAGMGTFLLYVAGGHLSEGLVPVAAPAALACGLAVLLAGALVGVLGLRERDPVRRAAAAPWLALLAFAFGSLLLIVISRYTRSMGNVTDTRYHTTCLLLSLPVVLLAISRWQRLTTAAATAFLCLTLAGWTRGLAYAGKWKTERLQDGAAIAWGHTLPADLLERSWPGQPERLLAAATFLQERDRLPGVRLFPDNTLAGLRKGRPIPESAAGLTRRERLPDGSLAVEGYARSRADRSIDLILFTWQDAAPGALETVIHATFPILDSAQFYQPLPSHIPVPSPATALPDWRTTIPAAALPDTGTLRVYGVDHAKGRISRISSPEVTEAVPPPDGAG